VLQKLGKSAEALKFGKGLEDEHPGAGLALVLDGVTPRQGHAKRCRTFKRRNRWAHAEREVARKHAAAATSSIPVVVSGRAVGWPDVPSLELTIPPLTAGCYASPVLVDRLLRREAGVCLYGLAPPKQATPPDALAEIVRVHAARLSALRPDGLVVYDIQDESDRVAEPRPFPFLPVLDSTAYAHHHLGALALEKIVYRCLHHVPRPDFTDWLARAEQHGQPSLCVFVGAPSGRTQATGVRLNEAYQLAAKTAPRLVVGGIAIAERHTRKGDEHQRLLAKIDQGCRFFVTQAVYDASSTKSLLSEYALAAADRGLPPVPIMLTFSPCGSVKTLEFMKWLGIAFPRWLENELRHSPDPLERSLRLCTEVLDDVLDFATAKKIPLGINVESVSIRKAEIDASVELFRLLRDRLSRGGPRRW
jgi:hypothetical protein